MIDLTMRAGVFLLLAVLALLASAVAVDTGFAVHMVIVCLAALIACWVTVGGADYNAIARGILKAPDQSRYDDDPVRLGVIATVFWGMAGFLAGLFIALQLAFPILNLGIEYTSFGRLRPLHTSAVIFAFGGNALIATSFYVVQRTCRARLALPGLARFVFWGYQLFIVLAATGYLLGITEGREYAEPEWYVDLWLTIVWVAYLAVFVGTILKRSEPHIYVANWFYLAFIITVAMLHLVNNLSVPVSWFGSKSYSAFAGVQDALTQWWYGHNAVGFFLTAGFLAMMYYFVPKQAERPVYSYRLSIIHFWSLIFLYIWAGPHHLHYTALPDWAQTLGMVFSVMLWMPSWGGMINGLMTLNGAWDKVRTDPIIRMMVMALAFYGMSTFEGPLMSIKSVNSLSHYTDWTIGHVHSGALGWNGMITFACLYYMTPRLWARQRLYSLRMVNWHFWLATVGIVFYASSMWVAGIMQGLMWREYGADGYLVYAFSDAVAAMHPMYLLRAFGGLTTWSSNWNRISKRSVGGGRHIDAKGVFFEPFVLIERASGKVQELGFAFLNSYQRNSRFGASNSIGTPQLVTFLTGEGDPIALRIAGHDIAQAIDDDRNCKTEALDRSGDLSNLLLAVGTDAVVVGLEIAQSDHLDIGEIVQGHLSASVTKRRLSYGMVRV